MSNTKRHIIDPETRNALVLRRADGSLRKLAVSLGYPESYAATLSDVLRGKPRAISRQGENDLRQRLGLSAGKPKRWRDLTTAALAAAIRQRTEYQP